MAQTPIQIVAVDHLDRSITLGFPGGKRVEYLLGSRYHNLFKSCQTWVEDEWYNHIVAQLTKAAEAIYVQGQRRQSDSLPPWAQPSTESTMSGDFKTTPNAEYRFTAIAPTAKSLCYNGQRRWYKTKEDALEFCGEVFESEKNTNKSNFDLAIVECVDLVRPKPQIEMISTWNTAPRIAQDNQKSAS